MSINPYAPPATPPHEPQIDPGLAQGAGPQPWTATGVIGRAWNFYSPFWLILAGMWFVTIIIEQIPGAVPDVAQVSLGLRDGDPKLLSMSIVSNIGSILVSSFMQVGYVRVSLAVVRGQPVRFGDLFAGGPRFGAMLGLAFLTALAELAGTLMCIVPGVIAYLGLLLAPYFVVDQNMGVIDSMRASWEASKGNKGSLFLLVVLAFFMLLAGMLACGVGLLVALAVYNIALTLAYVHITGRFGTSYDANDPNSPGTMPPFPPAF